MKNYFSSWNFSRALRLGLGIVVLTQGIIERDWMIAILGLAFSMLPILNIGCAGGNCATKPSNYKSRNSKEEQFEEIH